MKDRFTTLDVVAVVHELRELIGMRVANIYDINPKTYLIKLQKPEHKAVIMFESGLYIHRTTFDWPKSQFPSSFSMKLRKHVKQRRLEDVKQLGIDRIVDLTFGEGDLRVHVIIELYDRGNVLLTDHEYTILNILRPRTDKDTDVKFSVKNRYPVEGARQESGAPDESAIRQALEGAKPNTQVRRMLGPLVTFGNALADHAVAALGLPRDIQLTKLGSTDDERVEKVKELVNIAWKVYEEIRSRAGRGFIAYKTEKNISGEDVEYYDAYHPFAFANCVPSGLKELDSFSAAVDEFLSKIANQRAQQKALSLEKEAVKKLENVKKDHENRLVVLEEGQEKLKFIADRIIANKENVDRALLVVRSAIASQLSWKRIWEMCQEAAKSGDRVASLIVELKLDSNKMIMRLADPFEEEEEPIDVEIDIALSAFQNSRKFYGDKKAAAEKIVRTEASSAKALKSAQAKAKKTIEQIRVKVDVSRIRKQMWFEKFLWFISRDGLVVIAGRDAQQNELLVKRYLRQTDVYVHADVRGAASVIIRNLPGGGEIPPKTLTEAAQMAVCYSSAWEAKVSACAWWVNKEQVSRTAPSGEYLTAGSFMIRGKKNFLPASQLIMGFGVAFRLDDESVERRMKEKKEKETESREEEKDREEEEDGEEIQASGDDESDDTEEQFPDVQVALDNKNVNKDEEYSIITIGPSRPNPQERKQKEKEEADRAERERIEKAKQEEINANKQKPITKRQKHKMEKIKKKYGDQDDDERELRMALLGSKGKIQPKAEEKPVVEEVKKEERPPRKERIEQPKEKEEDDEEEEKEDTQEEALVNQLTGAPTEEDTLLYAVGVVAPYQSLVDYKYKVKLLPGTGKRGKAGKGALEFFLRSKECTVKEEMLIRNLIGDEQTTRNIPGKVKVSAPQLHKK